MSPEQLQTLQRLSHLFEEGLAGPEQIKQLSELLATINYQLDPEQKQEAEIASLPSQL